jgi:membrane peptidoglycan carboxypeptidase
MDALRYSLNVPSVQMQGVAGTETSAHLADAMGIANFDYIMAQDPGITLGLGTVPVNLTNFTQGYSVFAQQGTLHPATAILEIRDRDGKIVYTRDANGPKATNPLSPAEAFLARARPATTGASTSCAGDRRDRRPRGWPAPAPFRVVRAGCG